MLIISKHCVPKGYIGLTIFPFIFLKYPELKENKVLINHEMIHLRQQIELLIIPFFFWYILEFSYWFVKLKNFRLAYREISFEKECYRNDQNLQYLKTRPFWAFKKYLNHD